MGCSEIYDVIIIGGGPAGLTASLFTSRAGLKTLLIAEELGGLMLWTEEIDNYPGVPNANSIELVNRMVEQTRSFGTEIVKSTGEKVRKVEEGRIEVVTKMGKFEGKSLIIASGLKHRKLGVEGEDLPGVSYCAVCDGPLYEGMDVCVVGSGDSAMIDALFLSKIAKSVAVIVRGTRARASEHLKKKVFAKENVKFIWHSVIDKILGEKAVEGIRLRDLQTGEIKKHHADAVFIKVGLLPRTEFIEGFVDLTEEKFVKVVDVRTLETSQEGVFVAGDVRDKLQKQIATAVGDGCLVAESVFRYLEEQEYLNDPEGMFHRKKGLVEVDEKNYEIEVLRSSNPVMVEFWGPRCKDCIEMAPMIYKISEEYSGKVKFCHFKCPSRFAVLELGVRNLPTFYFYKDGNLLKSLSKENAIPEKIKEVLETIVY